MSAALAAEARGRTRTETAKIHQPVELSAIILALGVRIGRRPEAPRGHAHPHLADRHVVGHDGAGAGVGGGPDAHWCSQGGVGADEGVVADDGAMLVLAVVVGGDRSRAYVY